MNKRQKMQQLGQGILNIRDHGKPYIGRKDGGIPTKPIITCDDVLESVVTDECNRWLDAHRIVYDRNNCGTGDIDGTGRRFAYGIKGGGDIIGVLPCGTHFEIEYKRGKGGVLSIDQQERRDKIRASNGIYLVIHGVAELKHFMKGLL